jgi:alkylation response protein AidB-like acyl-CoA dehydrogenase
MSAVTSLFTPDPHLGPGNALHRFASDPASYEELAQRFRPIFGKIAEGAIAREQSRTLAFEAVAWLREAGFGALRIPQVYGGHGATLPQTFRLLVELGEADSGLTSPSSKSG